MKRHIFIIIISLITAVIYGMVNGNSYLMKIGVDTVIIFILINLIFKIIKSIPAFFHYEDKPIKLDIKATTHEINKKLDDLKL